MGQTPKYDYRALKIAFLEADPPITIRALAMANGIPPQRVSSIQRKANLEGWMELREQRQLKSDQKVVERLAGREARRRLRRIEIEDNGLELINESFEKMRVDMGRKRKERDPETGEYHMVPAVTYRPEQVVQLMDRIGKLVDGSVLPEDPALGERGPDVHLGLNINFDGENPEHRAAAAKLISATRGDGRPAQRAAAASPLPTAPGAGTDQ